MTAVTFDNLTKCYGSTTAVDAISLTIKSGSLFFLLGPSGCGKTTLLRMIAGFIAPTSGRILFDDNDVTNLPPNRRNTGMVFQNYALWPHLTVLENVAYGLDVRKVSKGERKERVMNALKKVQMQDYAQRRPAQLSGGQQQRIALARALVIEPTVLLLDEPLSNLDARLRLDMRDQLRALCSQTGITTIYVTHDQDEALSMADDMVVMRDGAVMQRGRPEAIYKRPASRFVADFLGESNFLHATVMTAGDGRVTLQTRSAILESTTFDDTTPRGGNVTLSIRPESLRILPDGHAASHGNVMQARRIRTTFLGNVAQHEVEYAEGERLRVLEMNPTMKGADVEHAEMVTLSVDPAEVIILPD
ncbi:MAG: ABC transporter ATP-binding protein [Phycisphaerales bacterium]